MQASIQQECSAPFGLYYFLNSCSFVTRKLSKQAETKQHVESLINMYAGYRCTQRTQDTELVVSAYNSAGANTAAAKQSVRHRTTKPMNAPQC